MKDQGFKLKGFIVWGIAALFFFYEFLLRIVVGTYQHLIMHDLQLDLFKFSFLSTTIFLLIYGLMQIPVGLIVDSIGLKKSLSFGALCCFVASFGFAYSQTFFVAILFRMLMGLGASFGFIGLLISVNEWMPHKYRGVFIGLSQFVGTMGPVVATGPLETFSHSSGVAWQSVFMVLGAVGSVLFVLTILFVENNSESTGQYTIIHKKESPLLSFKRLFYRVEPWYIAALSTCLYFAVEYLSENEGRAFLILKGIEKESASYMLTVSWIGYAIASPVLGLLSDILERRKVFLVACSIIACFAACTIVYSKDFWLLYVAFFALGASAASQTVAFALMAEQFEKKFVGVGFGLNNALMTIVAALNAPLIGVILNYMSGGQSITLSVYTQVFVVLVLLAVCAVILSVFFIKESFCKSMVDFTFLNIENKK